MALDAEKIARYLESAEWNLEQAIKVGDYRATQAHAQVSIAASNLILVAISLAAKQDEDEAQE
jgi:UBA-like domain